MSIARNLRILMMDKKISRRKLAEGVGIPTVSVSLAINGKVIPKTENLKKYADFLDVTMDELINGKS